jgi:hypothetical protein
VEQVLEGLQREAPEYPERRRQLAALRYYLHLMFWQSEGPWNGVSRGVTNHAALLDQIERWRRADERICLVTFNYDRLIETSLRGVGVRIGDLPDYIANDTYKLIKLHGSIDWAREVDTPLADPARRNAWEVAYELIERAADLSITQRYRVAKECPIAREGDVVLFPALAIPVESKQDYECPVEHVDALRSCAAELTKLLIIGWRATEVPFCELLAENVTRALDVMVVAGGEEKAREPIGKLQKAGIEGNFVAARGGFTDFIVAREGDAFLRS